ncbi:Branched-chain amino acid transport system permease protein livM (TC 3.A.1.4.1) [Georgfuchsia toluolica]|uniref:Branched-chain amino acid transport system permease protein livM (TC 3.A.1.4.1) n=1 Tax=Georgfuchsia toluolica TaxID=424218 RepID=A0A916J5N6_9PROT|nr:ABC transporter ATP-binding protein [Georgfuchsia toluolica]CAG4884684.1 Branched-chain amino acid transport system permease protein livM (TC 3.A.1.4.1) [Georgfuchsia toluolica]
MTNNKKSVPLLTVLTAGLLLMLPFLAGFAGSAWVRVLDFALLYIMLALGLNIVVGFAGLLDLGYIAFYGVGAYVYALLASPQFGLHWPLWVVLPLGAAVAGLFGILLGAPTLRLRGDYLAIVTLGFGEIIRIFLNNLNSPVNITNGPQGIASIDPIVINGVSLAKTLNVFGMAVPGLYLYYYLFAALALLIVLVTSRLQDSRIGRAWVAIREDEVAAKACGINTRNVKLLAFAMGASFGGVAGGLFAGFQEFVSPESFSLTESILVLCMVVIGGMGHIRGVIFGGLLLAVLPEVFRYSAVPAQQALFGKVVVDPESLRMLLFGFALIAIMLYRPAGLWPEPRHRRELGEGNLPPAPFPEEGGDYGSAASAVSAGSNSPALGRPGGGSPS